MSLWGHVREQQVPPTAVTPDTELWGVHPRMWIVPSTASIGDSIETIRTRLQTHFAESPTGRNFSSFQDYLAYIHTNYGSDTYNVHTLLFDSSENPRAIGIAELGTVGQIAGWWAFCALLDPAQTTSPAWTWPQNRDWYITKATQWLGELIDYLKVATGEGDEIYLHSATLISGSLYAATVYDWLAAIRAHDVDVTRGYIQAAVNQHMRLVFSERSGYITATSYPYVSAGAVSAAWSSSPVWLPANMVLGVYGDAMPSGNYEATSAFRDPRTGVVYTANQSYAAWCEELMNGDFGVVPRTIGYALDAWKYYRGEAADGWDFPEVGFPYNSSYRGGPAFVMAALQTPFQRRFLEETAHMYYAHQLLYCMTPTQWMQSPADIEAPTYLKSGVGRHPATSYYRTLGANLAILAHHLKDRNPTLAGLARYVLDTAWDGDMDTGLYYESDLKRGWLLSILHDYQRVPAVTPADAALPLASRANNGPIIWRSHIAGYDHPLGVSPGTDETMVMFYALERDPAGGLSHAYPQASHLQLEKNGPLLILGGYERASTGSSKTITSIRNLRMNRVAVFKPGRTSSGIQAGHPAYRRTELPESDPDAKFVNAPTAPWRGMGSYARAFIGSSTRRINSTDGVEVVEYSYPNAYPADVVVAARRDLVYLRGLDGEYLVLFDDVQDAGGYQKIWHCITAFPWMTTAAALTATTTDFAVTDHTLTPPTPNSGYVGGVWTHPIGTTIRTTNHLFSHTAVRYHGGLYLTCVAPTGASYRLVGGDGAEGYDFGLDGWVDRFTATERAAYPYLPDWLAAIAGRFRLDILPATVNVTDRFCVVLQPYDTDTSGSATAVSAVTSASALGVCIQDSSQTQVVVRPHAVGTSLSYVMPLSTAARHVVTRRTPGTYTVVRDGTLVLVSEGGGVTVGSDGVLVAEVA